MEIQGSNNQKIKIDENNITNERNYGIDLLRILSMFFVIILHCLGQGGLLWNTDINSIQYKFVWFLEICAYCAVDIFALISGYVSYTDKPKKFKISNYINMWLQIVFFGIFITSIFDFVCPSLISKSDYVIVLFPVINNLYWYFTAYTGLFFLMPFINNGIRMCSNNTMKKTSFVIILLFSATSILFDGFELNGGYSFIWITLIYILGATIKKCDIGNKIKNYQIIIGILFLYIITYLYKIYGFEISIFNIKITKDALVSYTSPTVLGVAILYLLKFSQIKFNSFSKKIIAFSAPSAFTIYILNNHRLIWNHVMKNLFITLANQSVIKICISVMIFSSSFVIISILMGKLQLLLFKKIKIKQLIDKIADFLNKTINKIINLI